MKKCERNENDELRYILKHTLQIHFVWFCKAGGREVGDHHTIRQYFDNEGQNLPHLKRLKEYTVCLNKVAIPPSR